MLMAHFLAAWLASPSMWYLAMLRTPGNAYATVICHPRAMGRKPQWFQCACSLPPPPYIFFPSWFDQVTPYLWFFPLIERPPVAALSGTALVKASEPYFHLTREHGLINSPRGGWISLLPSKDSRRCRANSWPSVRWSAAEDISKIKTSAGENRSDAGIPLWCRSCGGFVVPGGMRWTGFN